MANDGQAEEGSVSGGGRQPAAGGGCPTALPASDPPLSRRSVAAVFAGLLVAMTVGTLNQTIVATVLPTIVGELGGVNRMLGFAMGLLAGTVDLYLVLCAVWAVIVITGGSISFLNDTALSGSVAYGIFGRLNPFY